MKITLAVLLAWLTTIYCNSSAVLSLPPSLIINAAAAAASLRHPNPHQQHHQQGPTTVSLFPIVASSSSSFSNTKGRIPRWKKDTEYLAGGGGGGGGERGGSDEIDAVRHNIFDNIVRPIQDNVNSRNHELREHYNYNTPAISATAAADRDYRQHQQQNGLNLKRKLASGEYDLHDLLPPLPQQTPTPDEQQYAAATAAKTADLLKPQLNAAPRMHGMKLNELFTPLKYWARHCQPEKNCPQEYYRALLNGRNQAATTAAAAAARRRQQMERGAYSNDENSNSNNNYNSDNDYNVKHATVDGNINTDNDDDDDYNDDNNSNDDTKLNDAYDAAINNDVLMLLTGEQDVMKFLNWAMTQLYPYQKFQNFTKNDSAADWYHPDIYIWKKLNLSGRLEPPLIVEEPHYVIVRREKLQEHLQSRSKHRDDPFIPPRGRKHNMPDLDALLQRYETFVPNRGRRDKIKDIFKYDDLFYPNRGKKQKPPRAATLPVLMDNECKEDDSAVGGYDFGQLEIEGENEMGNDVVVADENAFGDDDADNGGDNDEDNDNNLTVPPSTIARRRMLGKLKKKLRQKQKRCLLQQVAGSKNHQQQQQTETVNAPATITNEIIDNDNNHNNEWWLQRMPMYKINEYDQSVKSSMPTQAAAAAAITTQALEEKSSPKATKTTLQQQRSDEGPLQQQQQHQWHKTFMNTRSRRVAGTFAGAARVAANRLHSTRSMSQQSKQHLQRQLQQQQQQQHHEQQPQGYRHISLPELSSQTRQQRRERERQQTQQLQQQQPQHEVKSLTDLDLLLWRQLQLLQQPKLLTTFQHPQHLHQQQQFPQQQPQETQLADVAAADAATVDDIDYIYSNI